MTTRGLLSIVMTGMVFSSAWAVTLSSEQIKRIEEAKRVLSEVSDESTDQAITWISSQQYPEIQIQMEEAITKTYVKLRIEHQLEKSKDKKWLYSMIKLNLAYLQFTDGGEHIAGNDDPINLLIQKTLKEYLSPEVLNHPGFAKSVE